MDLRGFHVISCELRGDSAAQELADAKAEKEESLDPWQEFARDLLA